MDKMENQVRSNVTTTFTASNDSPTLNGIDCPKCGEELLDSSPMTTLTSCPPQKNVNCSKCDYVGYRVC